MAPTKRKILCYEEAQMERALEEVRQGVPVSTAAHRNNVPRVTLLYKSKGKTPIQRRMGPERALTVEHEKNLVKWIKTMSKIGFPITTDQLLNSVQQVAKELGREKVFQNGRPSLGWLQRFKNRHPEISLRTAQNLTVTRASVKKENILAWFREVKEFLIKSGNNEILLDPSRVFNGDESAFFLNPKGGKVLAAKGQKTVYQKINSDEKECLTVLVTANAKGMLAPPMVVFKYDRLPREIANSVPQEFGIGRSDNGWMTCATFFEYITNIFFPWLSREDIKRPVILFIDGHTSHLTYHTSKFCDQNGIILIALYPNATHLMQPMDVAVFKSLKEGWKQKVHQWRIENSENPILKKKDFCPLLKQVLEERITESILRNGFRKCGLVPWDPQAIQFPLENITQGSPVLLTDCNNTQSELQTGLNLLKKLVDPKKLKTFQCCEGEWSGNIEDKSLYQFYKKITKTLSESERTEPTEEAEALNDTVTDLHNEENDGESLAELREQEISDDEKENDSQITNIRVSETNKEFPNGVRNVEEKGEEVKNSNEKQDELRVIQEPCTPETTEENNIGKGDSEKCISENQRIENVKRRLVIDGEIIPTPFKKALFWPKQEQKATKKRNKEKIPFVATSQQWQLYHQRKEETKLEKERIKKARADDRLKRKEEREKLKLLNKEKRKNKSTAKNRKKKESSSDSEESEEWVESGSSGDDVSDFEIGDNDGNSCEYIKKGEFLLVEFPGKKRVHRYVCLVQETYENVEYEVMALNYCNDLKTVFRLNERDISIINQDQIIERLPQPSINGSGDRVKYEFKYSLSVDG